MKCKCDCLAHNGFLTAKGLKEAAQRDVFIDGVAGMEMFGYLDRVASVSGLRRDETLYVHDDDYIDSQSRRALHAV